MVMSVALMRKISDLEPSLREVILLLLEEMERQRQQLEQQVTQDDFRELKAVVADLAEAQRQAEARLTRLETTVAELVEAQRQAEARLTRLETTVAELVEAQRQAEARLTRLETTVAELVEAQRQAEARLTRLETTVAELVEAQRQTQAEVRALAEAQKKTEAQLAAFMKETNERFRQVEARLTRLETTVAELAEAQKKTEEELRLLAGEVRVLRDRVEGVSNAVGYTLEDRALHALPTLLAEQGLRVEGRLVRKYIAFPDKMRQINIFGYARRGEERLLVLGEAKVRPSRKDIDRFVRLAHRLAEREGLPAHLLFIAYDFPPDIEMYARERGVQPVWSYTLAM